MLRTPLFWLSLLLLGLWCREPASPPAATAGARGAHRSRLATSQGAPASSGVDAPVPAPPGAPGGSRSALWVGSDGRPGSRSVLDTENLPRSIPPTGTSRPSS